MRARRAGAGLDAPNHLASAAPWVELNAEYASTWPNITLKKAAPADADAFRDQAGKYGKVFDPGPGG